MIICSLLSVVMVLRICMLMMDEAAIQMKVDTQEDYEYTTIQVSSVRGNIYDRQGYLLAGNTVSYTVALNLNYSNGHGDFIASHIAPIFDLDPEFVRTCAETPPNPIVEYTLTKTATKEQISEFEDQKDKLDRTYQNKNDKPEDLDSVVYYPNIHRYYPNDELAFNIIGFYPFWNANSAAAYGIEQYYDRSDDRPQGTGDL